MEQARPIVIRASQGAVAPGPPTPGMDRRQILDHPNVWVGGPGPQNVNVDGPDP